MVESNINKLLEQAMELDRLIVEKFMEEYPFIKAMAGDLLEKAQVIGVRILTDTGLCEFTCYYKGFLAQSYKEELLDDISVQLTPNFKCKPILEIKENALRNMINDQEYFLKQPFETLQKYLPDLVLKFIK